MKQYICPRCDDLLDANYPSDSCHNCGGFVRGIVPAKGDWSMSEMTAASVIQNMIPALILLLIILCFVFYNER